MPAHNSASIRSLSLTIALSVAIFAVIGFLGPSKAWAHKVNVFAYVEGDTVVTESYFSDGRKCRDSVIEVFDAGGRKLVEGKTDIEGGFSFGPPVRSDLLIRLTASMGHQAEYIIPAAELPDSLPASAPEGLPAAPAPVTGTTESPAATSRPAIEATGLPAQTGPAMADIEQAVDRAVARQLLPIRRTLEESRSRQRFSDVVGGIGYIIGLMGLVLYFRSRQRGNR